MLIPSYPRCSKSLGTSLSRRVNANSQLDLRINPSDSKLIKKGEC